MDSKNTIRKRMITIAAKSWGVTTKDIENADPIVHLLIDACASEIAKVNSEISSSRDKIGWKLMELLTPIQLTSPYPARAILQAIPRDAFYEINENNTFYFEKRSTLKDEVREIDIFFTPTGVNKLINAKIQYIACDKTLKFKTDPIEIQDLCSAKKSAYIESNNLWIGLHAIKPISSLNGISFHFELINASELEEKLFYKALSNSQWEINGNKIKGDIGFGNDHTSLFQHIKSSSECSKSRTISDHINKFYQNRFYTLNEEDSERSDYSKQYKKYPDDFISIFSEDDLNEIEGNIVWIKMNLPQFIETNILQKINCNINCFPIINRRADRVYISGKEKIKGLSSEEHEVFFDLKNYSSDAKLKIITKGNKVITEEGEAQLSIRHDNIGRFNSRNAVEQIKLMIDIYREEFQAFSRFKSINQDAVEDLGSAILPFENVLDELYDGSLSSMPYLILKTTPETENIQIQVDYWLNNGSLANGIPKEKKLRYDSADLDKDSVVLITDTAGGIDSKRNEELTNDFRYALMTRDRIVTKGDVKALCYKIFTENIESVEVKDGVTSSSDLNSGIRRSINITIRLSQTNSLNEESVKFLKDDLITHLKEKSSNILPFEVQVNN